MGRSHTNWTAFNTLSWPPAIVCMRLESAVRSIAGQLAVFVLKSKQTLAPLSTSLMQLFANQVRIVFFVFADRFHQLLIGHEIQAGEFDGPRSCICLWVFDGDFQIDVPKVAARVAFGDARRFALGVPIHVEPSLIVEAVGFDDQGIALPSANRVTVVGRLAGLVKRTATHGYLA